MSKSAGSGLVGVLYLAPGAQQPGALAAVAREFSPRIEILGPREITLDLSGLSSLFGDARMIAEQMRRTAADRSLRVRVAIAGTRTAARLLVRHRAGLTIVEPGTEAAALAALPLALLDEIDPKTQSPNPKTQSSNPKTQSPNPTSRNPKPKSRSTTHHPPSTILRRWGLRTLAELVALPPDEVMARLGLVGIDWQRLARGEDARPLVPAVPEERFEQSLELEWPIEGLEPLSFVLGRLMEPLSAHLAQRDRGAAVLHIRLRLVTRQCDARPHGAPSSNRVVHERSLELPAPMREAKTLRTLALLDLESHPPSAAIDCVTVAVDPTPARVVHYSLLTRPLPTPEQLSTLMARLHALMGESRCGSPASVDSWQPGAFEMKRFAPPEYDTPRHRGTETLNASRVHTGVSASVPPCVVTALRRFRRPIPARVQVEDGKPTRLVIDRRGLNGGRIGTCAGPWRTSGAWWTGETSGTSGTSATSASVPLCFVASGTRGTVKSAPWDRDEWDVLLEDGATYRLFRERAGDHWFVDGVVD
jgi:protein ImuB